VVGANERGPAGEFELLEEEELLLFELEVFVVVVVLLLLLLLIVLDTVEFLLLFRGDSEEEILFGDVVLVLEVDSAGEVGVVGGFE
jgi:hypothetical protein